VPYFYHEYTFEGFEGLKDKLKNILTEYEYFDITETNLIEYAEIKQGDNWLLVGYSNDMMRINQKVLIGLGVDYDNEEKFEKFKEELLKLFKIDSEKIEYEKEVKYSNGILSVIEEKIDRKVYFQYLYEPYEIE